MKLYWGDIHNHCGISYGYGSLENALRAAQEQLDFCSVTGHAMWPDMPERTKELEFLVDFHRRGFQSLREGWDHVRQTVKAANDDGPLVTFQGYEMHSSRYGDHHIVSPDDELPIVDAKSPAELMEKLAPLRAMAIKHHPGYTPGYRGANWDHFSAGDTPVVEVFSKHGCAMSDHGPYPYYHTMGPRDSRGTVHAALARGLRFGFAASSDHHAGYPGSYGDGRMAVLASDKTREAIWDAIRERRTYAVTGDKIGCRFSINGYDMGSAAEYAPAREIRLDIRACDMLDKIVIFKNLKPWAVVNGETLETPPSRREIYKVRAEMGWGKSEQGFEWNGHIRIEDGELLSVEPCFRGRSVLVPIQGLADNPHMNGMDNRVLERSDRHAAWRCVTFKNPSTLQPQTNAVIFEVQGDGGTRLHVDMNGVKISKRLSELADGSFSAHLWPYNSEAMLIHRAVPETQFCFSGHWRDRGDVNGGDMYHAEVRQSNGQYAWISPIWFNKQ